MNKNIKSIATDTIYTTSEVRTFVNNIADISTYYNGEDFDSIFIDINTRLDDIETRLKLIETILEI